MTRDVLITLFSPLPQYNLLGTGDDNCKEYMVLMMEYNINFS